MSWKYSVLVMANVTATSDELLDALRQRAARGTCGFTLLVPATGGGREGREAARVVLDTALERLREAELEVEGTVGDPDPIAAVHEVWDPMRYDEVIISTLPTDSSRWLALDLPHRIEKLTSVPVQHVVASPPKPPVRTEHRPERKPSRLISVMAAITGRGPQ
ncbi:MAG TPA: hypothetical protein VGF25_13035 [Thermoleophilaceae bacterium]|jgi:hypothetical protein